ncbi:MAG: hypothetical protein RL757_2841 [Bacteroidota bacterium]|jgi:hypothetical protein
MRNLKHVFTTSSLLLTALVSNFGVNNLSAQTITDANFANAIRVECPTCINASNVLQPPAASLTNLNVSTKTITSLAGLEGFTSLQILNCGDNMLTTLPTLPTTLLNLQCYQNQLTVLPVLPNTLTTLHCHVNLLTALPTLKPGLVNLWCSGNSITELPTLPNTMTSMIMDASITCIPNAVAGLTIFNQSFQPITPPVCTPMDIELEAFSAVHTGGGALLAWKTASEVNVSHFEIQRSSDGKNFKTIGKINAQNRPARYELKDANAINAITYYRLKNMDLDGTFEYSKIISLDAAATVAGVKLYPNPVSDVLFVENVLGQDVEIINSIGQTIMKEQAVEQTSFSMAQFSNGIYFVKIGNKAFKFVKQ